mgnify:CR=1 FL=1
MKKAKNINIEFETVNKNDENIVKDNEIKVEAVILK